MWVLPTDSDNELQEYTPSATELQGEEGGALVTLDTDPGIRERKAWRMAPWLRTALLCYVLPLVVAAVLWGVCYLLVTVGPLGDPAYVEYLRPPGFAATEAEWNSKRAAAASASAAAEAARALGAAAGGRLKRDEL